VATFEPSGLTELIKGNEAQLLRCASRYLREPQDARDAVQEAFIKLIKALRAGQEIESPPAWLCRVVRNVCLDFLKSKRLKVELSLEAGMDAPCEGSESPDGEASKKDDAAMLKRLAQGLDQREREILSLKVEQGKSYKEIASILDLSVSNVGFILHSAMKKMQKAYKGVEGGTPAKAGEL